MGALRRGTASSKPISARRGYKALMDDAVPSVRRVIVASPLIFVLGGTLDLILTDDSVGEVALRGPFVVALIIATTVVLAALQRRSRRQPRQR
jgi:hypothetical protein